MGQLDTIQVPLFEADGPEYESDYCAWLGEQARRLRLLRIPGLDTDNIAEEIEGLSRSDKRALASHIRVLLAHLLKWRYQPDLSGRSWRDTIGAQREAVADLLDESPSLRPTLGQVVERQYRRAMRDATRESGLPEAEFPASCEWTVNDILADDFFTTAPGTDLRSG